MGLKRYWGPVSNEIPVSRPRDRLMGIIIKKEDLTCLLNQYIRGGRELFTEKDLYSLYINSLFLKPLHKYIHYDTKKCHNHCLEVGGGV